MRILMTGGGTGGHIFPLIAVSRKLKTLNQIRGIKTEFLFVGPDKFSKQLLEKEGIRVKSIFAGKVRRYLSLLSIFDILKFPLGFIQAYLHIFWFMPNVVFSKGGYGSILPCIVAWLFRIPIIIHESDSIPGLSNRLLAKFSKRVLISFTQSAGFFPSHKTIITGNPIRNELFSGHFRMGHAILNIQSKKPILFVMGGSQGAQQVNELIFSILPGLIKKYEMIHQCGEKNFALLKKGAALELRDAAELKSYHLFPILMEEEIASAYNLANIIVSRAGSGAIFEIASSGKPSILIPYPKSAGNHQTKNAEIYKEAGAAHVLSEENIKPHMLESLIDNIVNNPSKYSEMSQAARRFAKPDAADKIAEEIIHFAL